MNKKHLEPLVLDDIDRQCEWQECNANAVDVRDTPWGDLYVCEMHLHAPLFDEEDDK